MSPNRSDDTEDSTTRIMTQMKRNLATSLNILPMIVSMGPNIRVSYSMRTKRAHMKKIIHARKMIN